MPTAKWSRNEGVRLEYLAWPGSQPALAAAVLVPGMAAPAACWAVPRELVETLGERGARTVLAVSLRGRGRSDCPPGGWTPEHHHADILAVLRAERVERCHLVGHSVGGSYALGVALETPHLVASVVVGDYPPVMTHRPLGWVRLLAGSEARGFHPDFPRRLAAESCDIDYGPCLASLEAPLLVVQGTGEGALLSDEQLERFRLATRLEIVKVDAGHEVFWCPAGWEACAAFLRRADGAHA